jgi:hypothetical protein
MDDLDRTELEQLVRLVKDNNRMLRAMRRDAFIGGVFKLFLWAAFIVIPLWFYLTYLAPVVTSAMAAMQQVQQVQGTTLNATVQFGELTKSLDKLKSAFPQYFQQ